jgi:hypothetical protein
MNDEEEQEGMLPAMKVNEKLRTIILLQRDTQDLRHDIQKFLWLKTGRTKLVVRQLMRLPFPPLSTETVEKGNLDGQRENMQLSWNLGNRGC